MNIYLYIGILFAVLIFSRLILRVFSGIFFLVSQFFAYLSELCERN